VGEDDKKSDKGKKQSQFHIEDLDINDPAEIPPGTLDRAIELEYRRQNFTFATVAFFALVGVVLLYLGISGSVNWSFDGYGVKTNLTNAAPGVVALVIAGLIALVQRPKVHLGRARSRRRGKMDVESFVRWVYEDFFEDVVTATARGQAEDLIQQRRLFDENRQVIEAEYRLRVTGYIADRLRVAETAAELLDQVIDEFPGRMLYFEPVGYPLIVG